MRPFRLTIVTGATHSKNQLPGAEPVIMRGLSIKAFSAGEMTLT